MKTTAIIGLGIIGKIWAAHYARAGLLTATWNRTPQPSAPRWHADLATLPDHADILHIVVADPDAVASILTQLQPRLNARHLILQSSTIDPESSTAFARLVTATRARYVEAPFTGSKPAAEQQKNVFYLGGSSADIADATDSALRHLSETRVAFATGAQAAALKLAMNLQIASIAATLAEALLLSRRAGIADETFFTAMKANAAWSPVAALKEPKLIAGDFAPQFSVKHMHKDMRLASRMAACADLPMLETVRSRLKLAESRGLADEDFSALIKTLD